MDSRAERKVWFDLSTSARWSGHVVGIIRVERELARRARRHLGEAVGFCVYIPAEKAFHQLRPDTVDAILDGELQFAFSETEVVGRSSRVAPSVSWKDRARDLALASPRTYQTVQKLRGHEFSLAQVRHMREAVRREREQRSEEPLPPPQSVPHVRTVTDGRAPLDSSSLVISGGLDWDHKDLRAIYRAKAESGFRYVAIVYDLIPVVYPHFVVPGYVELLNDYFGELFWTADACLCISACTQRDMLSFCAENGVPPPATAHFPLGSDLPPGDEVDAPDLPNALKGKTYAIFVSTIETRKNHRLLYQAWDYCLRRGLIDSETCRLVFVGRPGWNINDLMHEIAANPATRDTIVVLSNVSDQELGALYENAAVGLFPSFYEGYGLSLAELLSRGKVCLSSNAGALPEVGGSLVVYRDPFDVIGWAKAMAELYMDPERRAVLEARIRAEYAPVTWDAAAEAFFTHLNRLTAPQ